MQPQLVLNKIILWLMDRLRRQESFDDVSAEGLFRATTLPRILAQRGAIFIQGLPGLLGAGGFRSAKISTKEEVLQAGSCIFESSACVEHVDVFVSHRWGSGRWAKYLALCLYSNLTAAVVCSLTTWILATVCMIAYARGVANLGGNHLLLPILVLFPIGVFLVVFFLGHHAVHSLRPMSVWMDKACIHQTDHDFKHRQIQALPVFVARSSSMLVLWDEYFRRLWCQLELATFARYGGARKVDFLPHWLAPWLLSTVVANSFVAVCWYIAIDVTPEIPGSITAFCTRVLPPSFLDSASGAFVADAVWAVVATSLGTLASIPWTVAGKAKLQAHALMLEQMACFDCRAAQCTIEADRVLVEQQVQKIFTSQHDEEPVVQPASSPATCEHLQMTSNPSTMSGTDSDTPQIRATSIQAEQEALDAFNSYIRGPLRSAVMESVGSQLHVPYRMCLAATLPMTFYLPVDSFLCDDGCRSRHGLPPIAEAFLSETLYGLAVSWLIFPTYYPILLRMLKHASAVKSETLQVVLAALSAIATFSYGSVCTGMVYGLTRSVFQQGLIGFVPFYLLLIILLLLQLRCLFSTDEAVAGSSADGMYRPLHAADTFSI